jgi:hypothetical protein
VTVPREVVVKAEFEVVFEVVFPMAAKGLPPALVEPNGTVSSSSVLVPLLTLLRSEWWPFNSGFDAPPLPPLLLPLWLPVLTVIRPVPKLPPAVPWAREPGRCRPVVEVVDEVEELGEFEAEDEVEPTVLAVAVESWLRVKYSLARLCMRTLP